MMKRDKEKEFQKNAALWNRILRQNQKCQKLKIWTMLIKPANHPLLGKPVSWKRRNGLKTLRRTVEFSKVLFERLFIVEENKCIPLRGDSENFECKGNPGNFLAILKLALKMYWNDLPAPELADQELFRWRHRLDKLNLI